MERFAVLDIAGIVSFVPIICLNIQSLLANHCVYTNTYSWNLSSLIGCAIIDVGSSGAQTKIVTATNEYACPSIINKDNWIGGANVDEFSVQQRETDIVVTRTDSASGWGMGLKFECCGKVS